MTDPSGPSPDGPTATTVTPRRGAGMDPGSTDLVIVTGMSSAGRSTAANVLEDLGWYVVDNLPPQMLNPLVELASRERTADDEAHAPGLAAVVDVRSRTFFQALQDALF